MNKKRLHAYAVRDDGEGYCCVVFATNSATARREGAGELDTDWECIESCTRAPALDQYAPGPVPPMTLLEHGWWFECSHCGRRVSHEMTEELDDDGLDPANFVPRPSGEHGIFCSAGCECADHMDKRGQAEAEEALREVFEAKFSGAAIIRLHVYRGPKLNAEKKGEANVTFTFSGAKYSSIWEFGDEFARVPLIDVEAFNAWKKGGET